MQTEAGVLVIGAGGHAKVVVELLRALQRRVHGLTDMNPHLVNSFIEGVPVIGDDSIIESMSPREIVLANGLGAVPKVRDLSEPNPGTGPRRRVFQKLSSIFCFPALIHPSAVVAATAKVAEGAQIMARVLLQPSSAIGRNAIVNSSASIDHDCYVGDHAFIAPGVTLCGNVRVGAGAFIGAGAIILPDISIGENAIVAAGTVLRRDVAQNAAIFGR